MLIYRRWHCQGCRQLGHISAEGLCVACQEVFDDMLQAEVERYPDVQDAVLALAGAYSRAEESI